MMQRQLTDDDLQAYLDGVAANPQDIERILAVSEADQAAYRDLQSMYLALKDMPEPELSIDFAARVAATVKMDVQATPQEPHLSADWLVVVASVTIGLASVMIFMKPETLTGLIPGWDSLIAWVNSIGLQKLVASTSELPFSLPFAGAIILGFVLLAIVDRIISQRRHTSPPLISL